MTDPKIFLLQDNCFALKRWVEPETWGPLIHSLGFTHVEASFDNEMDFFYTSVDYRNRWFEKVDRVDTKENIKVKTFYTGYQTYRTAGLLHPDHDMRRYLLDGWVRPAVELLGSRGIDWGFALHAYPEKALQDPALYAQETDSLVEEMAEIAHMAKINGGISLCAEAMYSPHQTPWTIKGTKAFLKAIFAKHGEPLYTTVDLGHMCGQRRFKKLSIEAIESKLLEAMAGTLSEEPWLGPDSAYAIWDRVLENQKIKDSDLVAIEKEMARYPYLFSTNEADGDPYAWLHELGCYSPIVHMQQTNGVVSSHAAFTPENNDKGIIEGKRLLKAIAASYEKEEPDMPPKAKEINLAFEIFSSNSEHPREIISKLKATYQYWRQFIPEDGLRLSQLLERLGA